MRRLGAILMMLGANIAVGSIAAGFWRASFDYVLAGVDGTSTRGAVGTFVELMTSADGIVFWVIIFVGLGVFWWGKRMRAR